MNRLNYSLMYAVEENEGARVEKMLAKGANVNFIDVEANGNTPLHEAVKVGKLAMVKLLLAWNASPSVQNSYGQTPKDTANLLLHGPEMAEIVDELDRHSAAAVEKPRLSSSLAGWPTTDGEYKRREGTGAINGHLYESKLLALLLFRLSRLHREGQVSWFKIGANVDNVGNFDDILVKLCRSGIEEYFFIQAKHKDTKKITLESIKGEQNDKVKANNKQKDPFSLHSNFLNYLLLRKCFTKAEQAEANTNLFFKGKFHENKTVCIMYTSASVQFSAEEESSITHQFVDGKDFLKTSGLGLKLNFEKCSDMVDKLIEKTKKELKDLCGNEDEQLYREIAQHFLSTFWFYSSQGSQDEVGKILQRDILQVENTINDQLLFDNFHSIVQHHWMQTGNVSYLTERCDYFGLAKSFITLCFSTQSVLTTVGSYNVVFNEKAMQSLKIRELLESHNEEQIISVVSKAPILTVAKFIQHFRMESATSCCIVDAHQMPEDFDVITAFGNDTQFDKLLLYSDDSEIDMSNFELQHLNQKKMFFVGAKLDQHLRATCTTIVFDLWNNLSDLTWVCQDQTIDTMLVNFQSGQKKLVELVGHTTARKVARDVDAESLVKILTKEPFDLVPLSQPNAHEIMQYYVDRKILHRYVNANQLLQEQSTFCVIRNEHEIMEDNEKDILVISSSRRLFELICKKHENRPVHWLKENNDQLVWSKSFNSLENIIAFTTVETIKLETMKDITDRVMILTAEPGMGKTTMMTGLTEKSNESGFASIVRINLLDYFQQFKKMSEIKIDLQAALLFLLNNGFSITGDFKIEMDSTTIKSYASIDDHTSNGVELLKVALFVEMYNDEKIVVLFDGFDEILPKYEAPVLNLLQVLEPSKIEKLIVTTRNNSALDILEKGIMSFSQTIEPFTEENILIFFKSRWSAHTLALNETKVGEFINELVKHFSNSMVTGNDNFLGIPLHAEMIATCFEGSLKAFCSNESEEKPSIYIENENLDLVSLYDTFIKTKINIFLEEKCGQTSTHPNFNEKMFFTQFEDKHKRLALIALFEGDDLDLLLPCSEREKLPDDLREMSEKEGLICKIINGKPLFVHLSFAEYFAALVLWSCIKTYSRLEFETVYKNVFLNNLISNDKRQICKFLQCFAMKDSSQIIELEAKVAVILHSLDDKSFYNESFVLLLGMVEAAVEFEYIEKSIIDFNKTQTKDTQMMMFYVSSIVGYSKLMQTFKGMFDKTYLREQFLFGYNPVLETLRNGHINIAAILIKEFGYDCSWTTRDGSLTFQMLSLNFETLQLLAAENLIDFNKPVHGNAGEFNLPLLFLLMRKADEQQILFFQSKTNHTDLNDDLLMNYMLNNDICQNLFSYPLQVVEFFVNTKADLYFDAKVLEEILTNLELIIRLSFLIKKGAGFDQSFFNKNTHVIMKNLQCLDAVRTICIKEETDYQQAISELSSICNHIEEFGITNEKSSSTLKKIGSKFDKLEHQLIQIYKDDKLRMFSSFVNKEKTKAISNPELLTEIMQSLESITQLNEQYFHLFKAIKSKNESVENILNSLSDQHKSSILNSQCSENMSMLHYVAFHGNPEAAAILIRNGASVNLRMRDDLRSLDDETFHSPLHFAASNGHLKVVQLLCSAGADVKATTWNSCSTPLHLASSNGHTTIVEYLLEKAAPINALNCAHQTPLELAKQNKHSDIVQLLESNGGLVEEITPLLQAVQKNNYKKIIRLIEQEKADPNATASLSGYTPLHFAAIYQNSKIMKYLFTCTIQNYTFGDHGSCRKDKLNDWCRILHSLDETKRQTMKIEKWKNSRESDDCQSDYDSECASEC